MRTLISLVTSFALALTVVACAPASLRPADPVSAPAATPYLLDSGDRVRIDVFGQTEMSGEQIVNGEGNVAVPLLGVVEARGRTAEQLKGAIVQRLAQGGLLVNPQVNVQIIGYRPFFILGEVRNPGQFPYVEGMTVLTAVAISGGFTFRADQVNFVITRKTGGQFIEEKAQRNTPVLPGDVVYVQERFF